MDKNKIKIIIISFILLVIISIIAIFILTNNNKYKSTVFLGSNTRIKINGNKMIISNDDIEIEKQEVKIISGNKIIDGYILTEEEEEDLSLVNNNCHAYTEDGNLVRFDTSLIAYTSDLNLKFIPINNDDLNNIDILEDYFEENDIDTSLIDLDYLKISYFDYDKDSNYEYIYSLGYTYDDDSVSMVLMEKDGEYYLISRNAVEENNTLELLSIIDFNNSNNYYFIIKKLNGVYGIESYDLYNFNGNRFNKMNHSE